VVLPDRMLNNVITEIPKIIYLKKRKIMKHKNIIIKLALLMIGFMVVIGIIIKLELIQSINFNFIREYIKSYGKFAAVIYAIIFILRTLLIFFPSSIMVFLGGSLFGEKYGFVISMLCIFITASLAFFISRYAGKDIVNKILKGKMRHLDIKAEEHGFKLIFLMRLSIIFPFDIMNYAAGLSKIRYIDFILGTLLGITPEVISITYISSNIGNPLSLKFKLALILFIVAVAIPFFFNRKKSDKHIDGIGS
jgi:uncharacterized membrane protein YdjX (TVP38/TMEM64 family)